MPDGTIATRGRAGRVLRVRPDRCRSRRSVPLLRPPEPGDWHRGHHQVRRRDPGRVADDIDDRGPVDAARPERRSAVLERNRVPRAGGGWQPAARLRRQPASGHRRDSLRSALGPGLRSRASSARGRLRRDPYRSGRRRPRRRFTRRDGHAGWRCDRREPDRLRAPILWRWPVCHTVEDHPHLPDDRGSGRRGRASPIRVIASAGSIPARTASSMATTRKSSRRSPATTARRMPSRRHLRPRNTATSGASSRILDLRTASSSPITSGRLCSASGFGEETSQRIPPTWR